MIATLPRRTRGRQSEAAKLAYELEVVRFAESILQIASTMDFRPSSRGWAYLLEQEGMITKGDFGTAQDLVNDCRKSGLLPMDICSEDGAREWLHVEDVSGQDVDAHGGALLDSLNAWIEDYLPFSFWDDKPVYIEMMVEKVDLRELFSPVCARYRDPLANAKGWSDLHTRAAMMRRFAAHEAAGRTCVLLYCGDHDPAGLRISDALRDNLAELSRAVGWEPSSLIIDRFGLNYDFILANRLTWIDNLQTGTGKDLADPRHPDHRKPFVQEYIRRYGARKMEANALVVRPAAGRQLCEDAILRYLGDRTAPDRFAAQLRPWSDDLRVAVRGQFGAAV